MELPKEKLRVLFSEILRGYSYFYDKQLRGIFIKHLNNLDTADLDIDESELYDNAKGKGLPTNEEREEQLINDGSWSHEKSRQIQQHQQQLTQLEKTKKNLFLHSQIQRINDQIQEIKEKLDGLQREKNSLLGLTCETWVQKRVSELYIYKCLFKDAGLSRGYFETYDDLEYIPEKELLRLIKIYNNVLNRFNERNLRRLSLHPHFLNYFYLAEDNPFTFYGVPIIQLTYYQAEIFAYAKYYKSILSDSETKPDDEILNDPDQLVEWFQTQQNAQKYTQKNEEPSQQQGNKQVEASAQSFVGATKEDYKKMGIDTSKEGISIEKEMKKKGKKTMSYEEILNLHGIKQR